MDKQNFKELCNLPICRNQLLVELVKLPVFSASLSEFSSVKEKKAYLHHLRIHKAYPLLFNMLEGGDIRLVLSIMNFPRVFRAFMEQDNILDKLKKLRTLVRQYLFGKLGRKFQFSSVCDLIVNCDSFTSYEKQRVLSSCSLGVLEDRINHETPLNLINRLLKRRDTLQILEKWVFLCLQHNTKFFSEGRKIYTTVFTRLVNGSVTFIDFMINFLKENGLMHWISPTIKRKKMILPFVVLKYIFVNFPQLYIEEISEKRYDTLYDDELLVVLELDKELFIKLILKSPVYYRNFVMKNECILREKVVWARIISSVMEHINAPTKFSLENTKMWKKSRKDHVVTSPHNLSCCKIIDNDELQEITYLKQTIRVDRFTAEMFHSLVSKQCLDANFLFTAFLERFLLWGSDLELGALKLFVKLAMNRFSGLDLNSFCFPVTSIYHTDDIIEIFEEASIKNCYYWMNPLNLLSKSPQDETVIEYAAYYLRKMLNYFEEKNIQYNIIVNLVYPDFPAQFSMEYYVKHNKFRIHHFFEVHSAKSDFVNTYKENTSINVPFWVSVIKTAFAGSQKSTRKSVGKFLNLFCNSIQFTNVVNMKKKRTTILNQKFLTEYGLDELLGEGVTLYKYRHLFHERKDVYSYKKTVINTEVFSNHAIFKPVAKDYSTNSNIHPKIYRDTWMKYASQIKYDPLLVVEQSELNLIRDEILGELDDHLNMLDEIVEQWVETDDMKESLEQNQKLQTIENFFAQIMCLSLFYDVRLTDSQRETALRAGRMNSSFGMYVKRCVLMLYRSFSNDIALQVHGLKFNGSAPYACGNLIKYASTCNQTEIISLFDDITMLADVKGVTSVKMMIVLVHKFMEQIPNFNEFLLKLWKRPISVDVRILLLNYSVEIIEQNPVKMIRTEIFSMLEDCATRFSTSKSLIEHLSNIIIGFSRNWSHEDFISCYPLIEQRILLPIMKDSGDDMRYSMMSIIGTFTEIARPIASYVSEEALMWYKSEEILSLFANSNYNVGNFLYILLHANIEAAEDFLDSTVAYILKQSSKNLFVHFWNSLITCEVESSDVLGKYCEILIRLQKKYPLIDMSDVIFANYNRNNATLSCFVDIIINLHLFPSHSTRSRLVFPKPTPKEALDAMELLIRCDPKLVYYIIEHLVFLKARSVFILLNSEKPTAYQRCLLYNVHLNKAITAILSDQSSKEIVVSGGFGMSNGIVKQPTNTNQRMVSQSSTRNWKFSDYVFGCNSGFGAGAHHGKSNVFGVYFGGFGVPIAPNGGGFGTYNGFGAPRAPNGGFGTYNSGNIQSGNNYAGVQRSGPRRRGRRRK
ncbi:hypothetical protein PCE1_003333 [Barthelona sp. PCE]